MDMMRKVALGAVAAGGLCFVGTGTAVADPDPVQSGPLTVDLGPMPFGPVAGDSVPMPFESVVTDPAAIPIATALPLGTYQGFSDLPFADLIWKGKTFGYGTVIDNFNGDFPYLFGMTFRDVNGEIVTDYSPAGLSFLTDRFTLKPDGSYEGSFYINDIPIGSFVLHKDLPQLDELELGELLPLGEMPTLDELAQEVPQPLIAPDP
ncbi:hypothetical protein [Rhodococcus marinonascens]|uniref:hypothetical protein n=1 Tax=Rhodococcus marinonascens TaxID=38311 RepID=UPI0009343ADE|nr:hypothetical protein [Rhodococcus marinonascens]